MARALEYVGLLFLLSLASTFPWWLAAVAARAEYRRPLSALACSSVMPGFSLPTTVIGSPSSAGYDGRSRSGVHASWLIGYANPAGMTPTTMNG